jgi:hypothetical protein
MLGHVPVKHRPVSGHSLQAGTIRIAGTPVKTE